MSKEILDSHSREFAGFAMNGWLSLTINIAIIPVAVVLLAQAQRSPVLGLLAVLTGLLGVLMLFGYFTLQPNEARVLILFGRYKGTVRRSGFFWANPFYARVRGKVAIGTGKVPAGRNGSTVTGILYDSLKTKLSLRIHNFNSDKLKVNDKRGNPIEIAAVVVWRVADTAQAAFDVENYDEYVQVQSESAIRGIASLYAYDQGENDEITLRGGGDEVAAALKHELEARLARAGVVVEEARLTHLAYAPEIASAMLRRQQADAVIAARRVIVDGAVSMVDMALRQLGERDIVTLDEERKAAMVSNLMVVLCGTSEASPVINTGTLYN